ncbi:thioredoxin-dependent thiol peroxidase [Hellea sp.]|jgi:peroxiredoxin Q/BCP|nr:thioredoxin-dependent thiol peroxidase [Hellea sp.]MBT5835682.1 thioredoxin-dependent thiol peroxidase [Hellea sp.]MBT7399311.1 thioredoxin-dependent thiol peroxidase [Hellea sp.]MDA8888299.1 thioredoxin-dependent thiol peroxidase [Hellea sp.]MDB4845464.1 thioredoxin-dependent thiol peroxidase [Hellea sp.]MDC0422060.1 thioredoxin-dependent thiol peroxidase [Hellea sp.]
MELKVGQKAPNFVLPANNDTEISLRDYKKQFLVLYFYPKDSTPGCTKEAIDFSENIEEFTKLKAAVVGISKDTPSKHDKFIEKNALKVSLASDLDGKVIENYGAWIEKNMYGKKYMGIERLTVLIGPENKILQIWRKVRVKDHANNVLKELKKHTS